MTGLQNEILPQLMDVESDVSPGLANASQDERGEVCTKRRTVWIVFRVACAASEYFHQQLCREVVDWMHSGMIWVEGSADAPEGRRMSEAEFVTGRWVAIGPERMRFMGHMCS